MLKMNNTTTQANATALYPYTLYKRSYKSENTPEYGFGDYPETIISSLLSIHAKSLRSAQNQFKKMLGKRISFSGRFATYFVMQVGESVK
jgi:hypothetical protein